MTIVDKLSAKVADELGQHEMEGYVPSEDERFITEDFVQGLLVDDEFLRLVWHHYNETIMRRIEAGECVDCGRSGGEHWGSCGTLPK